MVDRLIRYGRSLCLGERGTQVFNGPKHTLRGERMIGTMTVKELKPAYDFWIPDSEEAVADSQKALTLGELASCQQAAMAKLKETTSAFDTLLEETITAVDECMSESDKVADEVNRQAAEKAAAVLAEAQAQANQIISEAAREGKMVAEMLAIRKVGDLIEAARSSAGRVARPDREQQPLLTGEIWAALESSIGVSFQSLLRDLQKLDEETIPKDQEQPQTTSIEARPDATEAYGNGEREMPAEAGIRSPTGQPTTPRPSHDGLPLFSHIGHSKPSNILAFKQSLRL